MRPMHNQVARTLRIVVFTLLLASTGVAILLGERLGRIWGQGELPRWAPLSAPVTFALFMMVFALDRLWAVQRQHYPPTRAIIQVAAAFLLLTLLLPQQPTLSEAPSPLSAPRGPHALAMFPAQLLLQYEDDTVRQATCELLAGEMLGLPHPMPPGHPVEALRCVLTDLADNDPVEGVREACGQALSQLAPVGPELEDGEEGGDCPALRPGCDALGEDDGQEAERCPHLRGEEPDGLRDQGPSDRL